MRPHPLTPLPSDWERGNLRERGGGKVKRVLALSEEVTDTVYGCLRYPNPAQSCSMTNGDYEEEPRWGRN